MFRDIINDVFYRSDWRSAYLSTFVIIIAIILIYVCSKQKNESKVNEQYHSRYDPKYNMVYNVSYQMIDDKDVIIYRSLDKHQYLAELKLKTIIFLEAGYTLDYGYLSYKKVKRRVMLNNSDKKMISKMLENMNTLSMAETYDSDKFPCKKNRCFKCYKKIECEKY